MTLKTISCGSGVQSTRLLQAWHLVLDIHMTAHNQLPAETRPLEASPATLLMSTRGA